PDLIWFDNLSSYGTPNYYVQQIFATNRGSDLLKVSARGEKLIGQNDLYASAVKDESTSEVIVKVVNTGASSKSIKFNIKGVKTRKKEKRNIMKTDDIIVVNYIEKKKDISPDTTQVNVQKGVQLSPYSVNVSKLKIAN